MDASEAPFDLGKRTREVYDAIADRYVAHSDGGAWNEHYERQVLRSLLPDLVGARVLDAGCAGGAHTAWLLEQGATVVALDLSPRMVELARERVGSRADVRVHDLREPLTFLEDGSVDVVVWSLVAEYLEDLGPALREFARVLTPGGALVMSAHHPFADWQLFGLSSYYETAMGEDHWDSVDADVPYYRRTMQEYFAQLFAAGFVVTGYLEPPPGIELRERFPEQFERNGGEDLAFVFLRADRP